MKKLHFWLLSACILPLFAYAQSDDVYFTPSKKAQKVSVSKKQSADVTYLDDSEEDTWYVGRSDNGRDVDEYNRMKKTGKSKGYVKNDTLYLDENEGGNDEEMYSGGYNYSKRLLRFHSPSICVPVSSPMYWDLCYGPYAIDWDVYVDGPYAYAFPTSSWSFWYGSYPWYSGWSWRYSGWGFNYGWYDPWWYHGPHWGWGGYYPPIYHRPHRPIVGGALPGGIRRQGYQTISSQRGSTGGYRWEGIRANDRPNRTIGRENTEFRRNSDRVINRNVTREVPQRNTETRPVVRETPSFNRQGSGSSNGGRSGGFSTPSRSSGGNSGGGGRSFGRGR